MTSGTCVQCTEWVGGQSRPQAGHCRRWTALEGVPWTVSSASFGCVHHVPSLEKEASRLYLALVKGGVGALGRNFERAENQTGPSGPPIQRVDVLLWKQLENFMKRCKDGYPAIAVTASRWVNSERMKDWEEPTHPRGTRQRPRGTSAQGDNVQPLKERTPYTLTDRKTRMMSTSKHRSLGVYFTGKVLQRHACYHQGGTGELHGRFSFSSMYLVLNFFCTKYGFEA